MNAIFNYGKLSLGILVSLTFLMIYLTDRYVLTADFYIMNGDPFFSVSGDSTRVYDRLQKWVYLSAALYLLFKLSIIALILHGGLFLQHTDVPFKRLFSVVVIAEMIFLIPAAIKVIHFYYTSGQTDLLAWHNFSFLSVLSIASDSPAGWHYLLKTLNVFEFAYWFMLAFGISVITGKDFDASLKIVVTSYLPALLAWVVLVTFITLLMFPVAG